jgi:hypothetical protein
MTYVIIILRKEIIEMKVFKAESKRGSWEIDYLTARSKKDYENGNDDRINTILIQTTKKDLAKEIKRHYNLNNNERISIIF